MLKKLLVLFLFSFLIACGASKSHKTNVSVNKKRVDSNFEELETESKKEKAEDLVLDEKPLEIKEKPKPTHSPVTKVPDKKRPQEVTKPHTIAEKKRPSEISNKKRPGSVSTKYPLKDGYPVWFFNPNYDGYLGGVGVARKSANGYDYARQKKTAKMLAEASLSKQIKVVLNTELNLKQTNIDNGVVQHYRSKLRTFSKYDAEQYLKNTVIKDEWKNPKTDELFVWVVIEK